MITVLIQSLQDWYWRSFGLHANRHWVFERVVEEWQLRPGYKHFIGGKATSITQYYITKCYRIISNQYQKNSPSASWNKLKTNVNDRYRYDYCSVYGCVRYFVRCKHWCLVSRGWQYRGRVTLQATCSRCMVCPVPPYCRAHIHAGYVTPTSPATQ